jgi:SagB-type dehydrogenase family enzyme
MQGMTPAGNRTSPSAGATYPIELYVLTADGVLHYRPSTHDCEVVSERDARSTLHAEAAGQDAVRDAAAVFVITGVFERTSARYGERASRYVHFEVGHVAQNLVLEATALGLGTVPIGSFDDDAVARVLDLPADHVPLYLLPVGRPAA